MKFTTQLMRTWLELVRNKEAVTLILVAAIAYAFYYPAAYSHQYPHEVPLVIVDEEASQFTRELTQRIQGEAEVEVVTLSVGLLEAFELVRNREAEAVLFIPEGAEEKIRRGQTSGIAIWINGTYLVRAAAIEKVLETATINAVNNSDLAAVAIDARLEPPSVRFVARFNPDRGYGSYIFPVVAPVILQQTLLFGTAILLIARRGRRKSKQCFESLVELISTWLALAIVSALLTASYLGWAFWFQDVPSLGSRLQLIVISWLSGMTFSAFSCAVGALFRSTNVALLVLIPTSLPIFFLSGGSWPLTAMPIWVRAIGEVIPSTHASRAVLLINEMGAGWGAVLDQSILLLLVTAGYLTVAGLLSGHGASRNLGKAH